MLLFVKLTSGIRGTRKPESAFCTHLYPATLPCTHTWGGAPPAPICTHLGPEAQMLALFLAMNLCLWDNLHPL